MSCEQLESLSQRELGLNHAYPPNLLGSATIAREVWESISQTTLVNCWLNADILPACRVESLKLTVVHWSSQLLKS